MARGHTKPNRIERIKQGRVGLKQGEHYKPFELRAIESGTPSKPFSNQNYQPQHALKTRPAVADEDLVAHPVFPDP